MTGNDLIRIIQKNNLGDKKVVLTKIPEEDHGCIMFMLDEGSRFIRPTIGLVCLDDLDFDFGNYEEFYTSNGWSRSELCSSYESEQA